MILPKEFLKRKGFLLSQNWKMPKRMLWKYNGNMDIEKNVVLKRYMLKYLDAKCHIISRVFSNVGTQIVCVYVFIESK